MAFSLPWFVVCSGKRDLGVEGCVRGGWDSPVSMLIHFCAGCSENLQLYSISKVCAAHAAHAASYAQLYIDIPEHGLYSDG